MKPFRIYKESVGSDTVYAFYTNDEKEDFTGLEIIDVRITAPDGTKRPNLSMNGACWVVRHDREIVHDRHSRAIGFRTARQAVQAIEAEFARWVTTRKGYR